MSERDRTYLLHIVECIERIEAFTSEGEQAFLDDVKSQDATVRNLQVLAESTKRISGDIKGEHPALEWDAIAGFRNVLVHEYLGVDLAEIWEVVTRDIPGLKSGVEDILKARGWLEEG